MKRIKAALAVILSMMILASCGSAINGKETAATVNGESISMGLLNFDSRYQEAMFNSYYGSYFGEGYFDTVSNEETGLTYGDDIVDSTLDSIEDKVILSQHAGEYNVALSDDQKASIDAIAQSVIDKNKSTAKKLGISKEDIAKSMELDTIRSLMYEPMAEGVDTEVSPEDAQTATFTYVRVNAATEDDDESGKTIDELNANIQSELSQVIDAVEATGDVAGADIDAIAKTINEDFYATTTTFSVNGENEYFDDTLIENAKALKDGEMTDIPFLISDGTAYFIVRLDKINDEEASATAAENIIAERKQANFDEILEGWRTEADVTENDEQIRLIKVTSSTKYVFKIEEEG